MLYHASCVTYGDWMMAGNRVVCPDRRIRQIACDKRATYKRTLTYVNTSRRLCAEALSDDFV